MTQKVNVDLIGKGTSQGILANQVAAEGRLNVGMLRPFIENGKVYTTEYVGGDPKKMGSYQQVNQSRDRVQTNATLRRDEWKKLDEAILKPSLSRLGGVQDLITNNLTYNLGNAMGTTVFEYHDLDGTAKAAVTMDGVTRGIGDRPNYETKYLPIPIIHVDYEINARVLAASRSLEIGRAHV